MCEVIQVTLGFDDHMSSFIISKATAEKMQAYYNIDQFVDACLEDGQRAGNTDEGVFLDTLGDTDAITNFLDDLAVAVAE